MYPKFIEVHGDGQPISVNTAHIVLFADSQIRTSELRKREALAVDESYNEIKQLITDAGCIIAKPDPRVDKSKPLTMEELKDMIGEPVWNPNLQEWFLVHMYADITETIMFTDSRSENRVFTHDDLAKYPLYRMKQ